MPRLIPECYMLYSSLPLSSSQARTVLYGYDDDDDDDAGCLKRVDTIVLGLSPWQQRCCQASPEQWRISCRSGQSGEPNLMHTHRRTK